MKINCKRFFLIITGIVFFSCGVSTDIRFHTSHEPKKSKAPFSDAVETKDFFFLSGQIGIDHQTRILVEGGIKTETQQAIRNIENVLKFHGLDLENVVKCTVILRNISDFDEFNEVYKKHFTNKPARTTFAASGLAAGASIEIDVIAAK